MTKALNIKAGMPASIAAAMVALLCLPSLGLAQTAQRSPHAAPGKPTPAQPLSGQAAMPPSPQSPAAGKPGGNDVVAQVGDATLSTDDIRSYVATLGPREEAALMQTPALLNQAVRLLLANRLVLRELQGKKWDQQPSIAAQLERVREGALVELYLQSVSTPPASYPSEDELQKVYDANRNAFLMPRQFELAQIFVPLPKDADKAAEDKTKKSVEDISRKLKAPGADFAALANENGSGDDGKNGGDLGWLVEEQLRPEIRPQVMGLAKGAVSDPVKLDDGWHFLKLIDTKASYTRTLPEVREQLVPQLRAERAKVLRQAYLAELIKRTPPVLNEIALSKVFSEQIRAAR